MGISNTPPIGGVAQVECENKGICLIDVYCTHMLIFSFVGTTKIPKLLKNGVLDDYEKNFEIDSDESTITSEDEDDDSFFKNYMNNLRASKAPKSTATSFNDDDADQFKNQIQQLRMELEGIVKQKLSIDFAEANVFNTEAENNLIKKIKMNLNTRESAELPAQIDDRVRAMLQLEMDTIKERFDQQETIFQQRLALIEQTNFIKNFSRSGDDCHNQVEKLKHDLNNLKILKERQAIARVMFLAK